MARIRRATEEPNGQLKRLFEAAITYYKTDDQGEESKAYKEEEDHLRSLPKMGEFGLDEFEWILNWKQDRKFGTWLRKTKYQGKQRLVRQITRKAFECGDPKQAIELLVNDGAGGGLIGVQYATASAILTFHDPTRYTVIDPRARKTLSALSGRGMWTTDSGAEYVEYLEECRDLSNKLGISLRDCDRALYTIGGADWALSLVTD
jgi:hypothetical protein